MVARRKHVLEGRQMLADSMALDRVKTWELVLRPLWIE
jgi:hypothetical protein